jgi:hypothetical protein
MSDDEAALARYGDELVAAVDASIGAWVRSCVESVMTTQSRPIDDHTRALIAEAARDATRDVGDRLHDLLSRDIDDQPKNPLSILRSAVSYPTAVLRAAGAQPVERDEFDTHAFPDDEFGLTPAAFTDLGPAVHEAGMAWGAAKAFVHLRRRRQTQ